MRAIVSLMESSGLTDSQISETAVLSINTVTRLRDSTKASSQRTVRKVYECVAAARARSGRGPIPEDLRKLVAEQHGFTERTLIDIEENNPVTEVVNHVERIRFAVNVLRKKLGDRATADVLTTYAKPFMDVGGQPVLGGMLPENEDAPRDPVT